MLKVLAFADFPSPYRVDVFSGLTKEYELTVFFDKMSDQNRNCEWFCKETGLNSYLLLTKEGIKEFKKNLADLKKYDLVLAYDYHIKNAIKLQLACMWQHVPYIMNCDGAFIRNNLIKNLLKKFLIKNATAYFASGEYAKKYFEHYGAKKDKIFIHKFSSLHEDDILQNPVSESEKKKLKEELGLENKKTVLSIGQFIPRKGFDVLLEAWKELDKDFQLVIIGGGDEEKKYLEIIKESQLQHVKIIGFRQKSEVFKYYKASELFVLPTREDIWGLVINEAMACGLPVITTEKCLGGVELLKNEVNGKIVSINNSSEIVKGVKCIFNSDEYNKMSYANLDIIRKYTVEQVIIAHIEAINQIIHLGEMG